MPSTDLTLEAHLLVATRRADLWIAAQKSKLHTAATLGIGHKGRKCMGV
jgi:hypothetical protein